MQSARAVVLLGQQHDKFWATADAAIKSMVPTQVYEGHMKPRVDGFKAAAGCVSIFPSIFQRLLMAA